MDERSDLWNHGGYGRSSWSPKFYKFESVTLMGVQYHLGWRIANVNVVCHDLLLWFQEIELKKGRFNA